MVDFVQTLKERHAESVKAVEKYQAQLADVEARLNQSQLAEGAYRAALEHEELRQEKPGRKGSKHDTPAPVPEKLATPVNVGELPSKTELIQNTITRAGANGIKIDEIAAQLKSQGVKRQYVHTVIFKLKERHLITKRRDRYYAASAPRDDGQPAQQALLQ
jgi:hypothetical protein